jgi:uncharacterized membrane protein HdeD (DUF308 family)
MGAQPQNQLDAALTGGSPVLRSLLGALVFLSGCLALATPVVVGKNAPFVLGLLLGGSGVLQALLAFAHGNPQVRRATFFSSGVSLASGLLLISVTKLVFTALTWLLGLSWVLHGGVMTVTALRGGKEAGWRLLDGLVNIGLGVSIALQWPLSGIWSLGLYSGLHIMSSGWSALLGRTRRTTTAADEEGLHPDPLLGLRPHPEIARLRAAAEAAEAVRQSAHRYWCFMFVLIFFAIHIGRMDTEWNLVGLFSPAVAVVGDVCLAVLLAYILVLPGFWVWQAWTRPWERRAWHAWLDRLDQGQPSSLRQRLMQTWLLRRLRLAVQAEQARGSPTAAVGRGLQIGLPLSAILIALNPIWGFSWYFNTENWASGFWDHYAAIRTDTWRAEMVQAVKEEYRGKNLTDGQFFQVTPEGVTDGKDFSFIVIGDTGEGDASQHILRDQFLLLNAQPEMKFLVVSSDVIYPSGAMKDYEPKFYLPFKGFTKPIYAVPGNHDWYDALEAFTANFLEPDAARAAMRGRRRADHNLTTTTEQRINGLVQEAAKLREFYGVHTGLQRAPYFEVQTERFALIVVDTGVLKTVDKDQMQWLRGALERAKGKFKLALLGHPLYAGGHYQGEGDPPFAEIHRLLREHGVEVAMAGDTHFFEFYREEYEAQGQKRHMLHFTNGGGGAYLSIGTALAWPEKPPVADWAYYPRTDAIVTKLDSETPPWKQPLWYWVKRWHAWPSTPEEVASAFDFNRAPFYQSFMEVKVENSANVVRLLLYGPNGRLRWRDLQLQGRVIPEGKNAEDLVEFRVPLPPPREGKP